MPLSDLIARQKTMETYINEDSQLARQLIDAGDNVDLRRDALKSKILDKFLEPIIDDDKYIDFVDEIVNSIISKHPEERTRALEDKLGVKKDVKKKAIIKKKLPKVQKNIEQKTATGKKYFRSYKNWSSLENQFIKARVKKGYSAAQTRQEFISFFGSDSKTKSSISTKFYRLRSSD